MKQVINRILAALLCVMVFFGVSNAASQKREVRSVWLATVWGIDWPSTTGTSLSVQQAQKKQMIKYLDELKANNMTGVCFQVRSMNDAMYKSKYCPWSSYLTGTRGVDPGWDPLAFVVEECHKRGLECYAWLNPYRHTTGSVWNTAQDRELENGGWLLTYGKITILNPGLDKCRQRIVDICKEIVVGYAVDGILFDDYFYPDNIPENSSAEDYQLWKKSGTSKKIGDWRRENVNKMVADVYNMIQANRPDVRFGISPAGVACTNSSVAAGHGVKPCPVASDWQYNQIYSDPVAWVKAGTLDFISPQIYWLTNNGTAPYGPIAKWWSQVANQFNRHFYSSHSVSILASDNSLAKWQDFDKQIQINRDYTENNAPGSIFYSAKNIVRGMNSSDLSNHLKTTKFNKKALHPVITWKKSKNLGKVSNLALNGGKLTWTGISDGKSNIRYTIYAVPHSVSLENAMNADGDGLNVDYLLDLWYSTSYTLPSDKQGSYWYAVCAYDGYSNEYDAAVVNYSQGSSKQVMLTSPIHGSMAEWENTFIWTEVPGAVYRLQIASDGDFKNIIYDEKEITTNSLILDLYKLTGGQKYYWRVYCREQGKLESVSAAATFTAPAKTSGKAATLIAPADGAKLEDDFSFSWNAAGDIDIVEVSTSRDFNVVKYSAKVTRTTVTSKHRMNISLLGKGTFYWRIRSTYKHYTDAVSAVRSFEIIKVNTGETEPGYVIKTDDGSYASKGNLSIENIWFRSIREGYVNHPVETSGSLTRAMTAKDGIVYLTERAENSSSSDIYLRKINGTTGEVLGKLKLSDEGKLSYFPCNDVIQDSKGNVCISNMVLNANTADVKLHSVDLATGALTERASVSTPENARIDHVAVYGDVASGNFWMFAASSGKDVVYRWTYVNGKQTKSERSKLRGFYPSGATNLGVAPRIIPVDHDKFFVDGGSVAFTLYSFSSGSVISSFASNRGAEPEGLSVCGGVKFKIGETDYVAYPYGDDKSASGYQFAVASVSSDYNFANMNLLWTLPQNGLGKFNSTTVQAPLAYEEVATDGGIIYFYVPGDGLAAYRITDKEYTGTCDITEMNPVTVTVADNTLYFSETVDNVTVYTATGAAAAFAEGVQSMKLELEAGVYIINAVSGDKTLKQAVVIR